jgi:hypothetical protein
VQLAEFVVPVRLQGEGGLKVPVLLVNRLTVPVGVRIPGETSVTVTVHEVGTPTVTDEPHMIPVVVEIRLTVNNSQPLVTWLLFVSPLYVALKLYWPGEVGVWELEGGTEFPAPTFKVWVDDGVPLQTPLPRPKKRYVTDPLTPVDGNPPAIAAWSATEVPRTMLDEGVIVVVSVGVCLLTVRGSQFPVATVLFPFPLYTAEKPKKPGDGGVIAALAGTELPTPTFTVWEVPTIVPAEHGAVGEGNVEKLKRV